VTDNTDNPGIRVPPPLIYVVPLVLGLVLDKRRHVPFLPRGRLEGWGSRSWEQGRRSTRGSF
jgi:hypothetical protein